jgi:hypothetical protein
VLEILALISLTRHIGRIVEAKGRKSGWYKVMLIAFWLGGEGLGAILAYNLATTDNSSVSQCISYLVALAGAAIGAGIAFAIANSLTAVVTIGTAPVIRSPVQPDRVKELERLKAQMDNGRISIQEYEVKKNEILSKM